MRGLLCGYRSRRHTPFAQPEANSEFAEVSFSFNRIKHLRATRRGDRAGTDQRHARRRQLKLWRLNGRRHSQVPSQWEIHSSASIASGEPAESHQLFCQGWPLISVRFMSRSSDLVTKFIKTIARQLHGQVSLLRRVASAVGNSQC
jgi:hypothetical protein